MVIYTMLALYFWKAVVVLEIAGALAILILVSTKGTRCDCPGCEEALKKKKAEEYSYCRCGRVCLGASVCWICAEHKKLLRGKKK